MTNKEVVKNLINLGHQVKTYTRKDGSLRVVELDGQKFSSRLSLGNQAARDLLENKAPTIYGERERRAAEAVATQRKAAQASRASGWTLKSQSKEFQAEYKKMVRQIRKANRKLAKQGRKQLGIPTWEKTKKLQNKTGLTFNQLLNRAKDYYLPLAGDIAPRVMVQGLINAIRLYQPAFPEIKPIGDVLEENIDRIDLYTCGVVRNWVYGYVQGIKQSKTPIDIIQLIKNTLH